jgi:hypothetical protein
LWLSPYLSLGQVYSALAYYWDHQAEIDQEIEHQLEFIDRLRQAQAPSPLVKRLKAKEDLLNKVEFLPL